MTNQILVLANQDHIEKGNLPQSYMVQVFDALVNGTELYIDAKEFTDLELSKEVTKVVVTEKPKVQSSTNLNKLIKLVQTKCVSSKGTMLVDFEGVQNELDVFERVIDEIVSLEIILDSSDIEEEIHTDMSEREANGLLKKMKTFVKNNAVKFLNTEEAEEVLNQVK